MNYLPTLYVGLADLPGSFGTTGLFSPRGPMRHAGESAAGHAIQNATHNAGPALRSSRGNQINQQRNSLTLLIRRELYQPRLADTYTINTTPAPTSRCPPLRTRSLICQIASGRRMTLAAAGRKPSQHREADWTPPE